MHMISIDVPTDDQWLGNIQGATFLSGLVVALALDP
jgi:hypothetical protein